MQNLSFQHDSPAGNPLGGYRESVGRAKRKCCDCMADFDDIQKLASGKRISDCMTRKCVITTYSNWRRIQNFTLIFKRNMV